MRSGSCLPSPPIAQPMGGNGRGRNVGSEHEGNRQVVPGHLPRGSVLIGPIP